MIRGQVAIEYLIVAGFASILLVGYLIAAVSVHQDTVSAAKQAEVDAVARQLQSEIILATQAREGFERDFTIPLIIKGSAVTLERSPQLISVRAGEAVAAKRTPPFLGSPVPGTNRIVHNASGVGFI